MNRQALLRRGSGPSGFADPRTSPTLCRMLLRSVRRLSVLLLTLMLVMGVVAHGVQAAHMDAMMPAAAIDQPMPDNCDLCEDEDSEAGPACSAMCAGVVAVLPMPLVVEQLETAHPRPTLLVCGAGLHGPPDPFPPKRLS